jgi:signal recognition particle GTPase
MPRTKEASRQAGLKAAETLRTKHEKMQKAGEKSWDTREKRKLRKIQVKIGRESASKQKSRILAVRPFLKKLKKTCVREDVCVVCAEPMRNTLDRHHLDGNRENNDSSNFVTLCASCHRIIDKAKSPKDALVDLKERHKHAQF